MGCNQIIETSAKLGENVKEAFEQLCQDMLDDKKVGFPIVKSNPPTNSFCTIL